MRNKIHTFVFETGDSVTIVVYDLSDESTPVLTAGTGNEVGSTGIFAWNTSDITTPPTVKKEYLIVASNGTDNKYRQIEVNGVLDDINTEVLQLRKGNVRTTLNAATVQDVTRKVEIGSLDNVVFEIKNDDDPVDFSVIRSTKTLYAWYDTLGDINPSKIGEDG